VSDLAFVLNRSDLPFAELPAWRDALATFASGSVPHCWAVAAPAEWHGLLRDAMAGLYLCDTGRGGDDCAGCRGWSRNGQVRDGQGRDSQGILAHPDLTVVGEIDKAGNIEACRALIKELFLKPVVAKRRLGVVLAADKLLAHAANSLLKIAEEPPLHACLLFLLEGDNFLPTLRSRSRFTVLGGASPFEPRPAPRGEMEWLQWLNDLKDDEDIPSLLSSWTSHFLQTGNLESAVRAEKLRLLVLQKRLSQTMTCDLLILTLKEELPFEHIFDGFR
jgi:DNA polymerase-3 subunit delta'